MRKYEPVWQALKADGSVSLSAEPETHARIIQAVRNEKSKDLGWKLTNSEGGGKRYKLKHTIQGKLVTFSLLDTTPLYADL